MLKSIEGNFDNPEVHELLVKHFIELRSVSPEGSTHVLDITGLKDTTIKFWSLWEENQLMGVGALKFLDKEHGEFKSIRVNDKFRNKGNGSKVINHLINGFTVRFFGDRMNSRCIHKHDLFIVLGTYSQNSVTGRLRAMRRDAYFLANNAVHQS